MSHWRNCYHQCTKSLLEQRQRERKKNGEGQRPLWFERATDPRKVATGDIWVDTGNSAAILQTTGSNALEFTCFWWLRMDDDKKLL